MINEDLREMSESIANEIFNEFGLTDAELSPNIKLAIERAFITGVMIGGMDSSMFIAALDFLSEKKEDEKEDETPLEAITRYCEAINSGDADTAWEMIHLPDRDILESLLENIFSMDKERLQEHMGVENPTPKELFKYTLSTVVREVMEQSSSKVTLSVKKTSDPLKFLTTTMITTSRGEKVGVPELQTLIKTSEGYKVRTQEKFRA